jgi:acyl transferase domain-containing protein/aryl carrier-like protein
LELLNSNDRDSIATRTSFVFGLTGPSVNVQSACSTSLVAVAQACQALATGQCDVAIAGGVTVTFPQRRAYRHESGGMYSRDGHCRAFDAEASGTTFSDGAGVVILKRFDQAARDGDRIDAIVRGWAVNNDGSTKASFAAPSVEGQVRVITAAQEHAGVRPRDVSYVEAHGTGTPIGDPIEFTALERAFRREGGDDRGFCGLGSVKSNIGHVDAAAGVAGLIKTVLALKYRELPATLHFRSPNPEIALATSPFYIVSQLTPWHARGPRIAGVSSLGVGGTNCHVVLEEPPDRPPAAAEPTTSLVTLSAASPDALDALEARYRDFVASDSSAELVAVASTSQRHRAHRRYRTAIRCGDRAGFLEGATTRLGSDRRDESLGWRSWRGTASDDLSVGFLFAGQGSQYAGMGRALYEENLDFRRLLDRCNDLLRSRLDRPLLDVMFGAPDESLIDRTEYAQPAIFALEYSIAALLRQWGIQPRMVLGHSVGEYVAACVADVFSLEDGLRLSADRGRLMQRVPGTGRMLAVASSPDAVRDLVRPVAADVSVAAFNSPFQTVISGHGDAVARLEHQLREQGVHTRTLAVSHAFHSPQMDSALQPLEHAFEGLSLRPAAIPVVSNVTGRVAGNELTQSAYWSTHARAAVQFADSIRTVIDAGCDVLVEIGPDSIFSTLVRENDLNSRLTTIATLHRAEHGWAALLDTLGQLYVRGAEVDWKATHGGVSAPPVRLPGYPFQRHRHWYEGALANKGGSHPIARADGHPLLGSRLRLPGSDEIRFEVQFSQTAPHYLADHRLFGVSLPPGASHFAMLAQAADVLRGGDTARNGFRFESLYLLRPLLLPDGCGRTVQLILRPRSEGWEIELTSALLGAEESSDGWTTHMVGRGRAVDAAHEPLVTWDLEAIRAASTQSISGRELYSKIWANHGGTGSSFRWIDSVWQGNRVALCRAKRPRTVTNVSRYRLHPGLVEAACQVLHCCGEIETAAGPESSGATYVPFSVDALSLTGAAATHDEAWCHARLRELTTENVIADLTILSSSGEVVAQLDGFCLRQISRAAVIDRPQESSTAYPGSHFGSAEPSRPLPISAHDVALYLRRRCAELTGHVESELRLDVGFAALGLDSIAAMRLSNQMLRDLGRTVHLGQILTCSNLLALAEAIATEDGDGSGAAIPTRTVPSQRTEGGSTVDARGSGDPE